MTVHDIAAFLIEEQVAADRPIDKLQLQKLLFLVQGAHIGMAGTTAFRVPFLAYAHGPVIEQVEQTYREFTDGRHPIPRPLGGDSSNVDPEVQETARFILEHFGTWTGPNLEAYVKKPGSPWTRARVGIAKGAPSRNEIPLRDITRWFVTRPVTPGARPREDVDVVYDDIDSLLADLG